METWRCFVAVDLPRDLRADLASAVEQWQREPEAPAVRWTDPASWHLTLAFLGSLPVSAVDLAGQALERLTGPFEPMVLDTDGLGAFPSPGRARVLWYGVADPEGALGRLAGAVRTALEPMAPGLADESPFRGHVTIARGRDQRVVDASAWLASHQAPRGRMPVRSVRLYRSHLGGQRPARYELIREVAFEREASVHG